MSENETRNLGELFREALANQPYSTKKRKKYKRMKGGNKTGIASVSIINCPGCKQGFVYKFTSTKKKANGDKISFSSVDILRLKERAIELGYKWRISNEQLARRTARKANISYEELI